MARCLGLTLAVYNRMYLKGWAASRRTDDMEAAEARFVSRNRVKWSGPEHEAWEDGWLDVAAGREMWHLRDCEDHDNCP